MGAAWPAERTDSGHSEPVQPGPKHCWIALPLTFIFGPLGLRYASNKGALILLVALFGVPVGLSAMNVLPFTSPAHPVAIPRNNLIMNAMWSMSVALSMAWSVLGVHRYDAALRGRG